MLTKTKRILSALGIFLTITCLGYAAEETLTSRDIKGIMNQMFELHVDQKEISPLLLKRSFYVYLDDFDPERIYLLNEEVSPFLEPSDALLADAMERYKHDDLFYYKQLTSLITKAIERSREWRTEIEQDKNQLYNDAHDIPSEELFPHKPFASTPEELKGRLREKILSFVEFEKRSVQHSLKDRMDQVVTLYEKRSHEIENPYLSLNLQNNAPLSANQENDLCLLVLKSLAKSLDAHTAFFSANEAYNMKMQLEKNFQGIGIVLQEGLDGIMITRLIKGGPAERCGKIEVNDRVVKIDGKAVDNLSFDEVLDLIRGKENSTIVLSLKRSTTPGETSENDKSLEVSLKREKIILSENRVDTSTEPYGDGIIGKIALHAFYEGDNNISSERDLRKAIADFKKGNNLKGIVLDLRDNLGGFLSQAIKVSGLFITGGVVAMSKYSDGEEDFFRDVAGRAYYEGPLVVLISKGSASAAEIVTQALQDYGVAIVVGDERTYGKGSIQHQTITNGKGPSFFKVTVGRYYTVSGRSTQITGVLADIVVPSLIDDQKIGEQYLDYPLKSDSVAPAYNDLLVDIPADSKVWFTKYYIPTLQKKESYWQAMLPTLKQNSKLRIANNKAFQEYLKKIQEYGQHPEEMEEEVTTTFGLDDIQMKEAVNILKDMISLEPKYLPPEKVLQEAA